MRLAVVSGVGSARGNLDWTSPAGGEVEQLNSENGGAYQEWMAPFVQADQIRQMPMLVVMAVVAGPIHAIARRWLAGQVTGPLHRYKDHLTGAATAALSGRPAPSRGFAGPNRGTARCCFGSSGGMAT